ncbi:MAG: nicotinamide riboside transporter PnuC [Woeseiaceae bacterium]|nr:nicotinamide riboside transporter PnuC [Woeseiaceae bacterium]
MTDFVGQVLREADALSILELVAFLLGGLYLLLAIRESIWCWLCAFISSSIFAYLFFRSYIYMDAALQIFYAAMAIYGWYRWRGGGGGSSEVPVLRWPFAPHAIALSAVLVASLLSGFLLERHTDARYPYIDSATTFASLWATFLVARKVLENWWYWLVIDSVSIAIYVERGLEFAALLFAVYVVMIPFGLVAWTRSFRASEPAYNPGSTP